jgi:hypothetical protein
MRRRRVGREDDRVPRLHRNERLVDYRRGRIGAGRNAGDEPYGRGDFRKALRLVFGDDVAGFKVLDILVYVPRGEEVFLDLVFDHAEPGIFDCQAREPLRRALRRPRRRGDDAVHRRLVEGGERRGRALSADEAIARLLNRL